MNNSGFSSCTTTTGAIYADNTGLTSLSSGWTYYPTIVYRPYPPGKAFCPSAWIYYPPKENKFIKEGIEMKGLYDVYLVYGEDREDIVLERAQGIIANDEEDAKIKSGLMKKVQEDWDSDYLTFIVRKLGEIFVKEKPKEVRQIS